MPRGGDSSKAFTLAGQAEWDPGARRRAFLSACLLPSLVVLALALVFPLFYNAALSLSDADLVRMRDWRIIGLRQYVEVLSAPAFWAVFAKTAFWTIACTGLQIALGVSLALVLCQRFVRGQSAWRVLLMLPWAMPQYITAMTWREMFHGDQGAVNSILGSLSLPAPDWLGSAPWAFAAALLVNVWMGYPFMMVVALAGLKAIPDSVYEAARLEGASPWQKFTLLTAPLLRPVMLPATTLGIVWNFNSLNVIWLFSAGGEPGDSTHILTSYVYKAAFTYYRFGWAAALSVVIFVILFFFVQAFLQASRLRR